MRFVLALLFLLTINISAQVEKKVQPVKTESTTIKATDPLDVMTVTATRSETRIKDAPASVSVIDIQDVKNAAAQSTDDLLRQVPGFSIFRRSSGIVANPTTQGVSLRGAGATGASRTLVLTDGLPLNDAFGGWVYWDRIPRESISNIEVVRGGTSDLYGSDALSGVINVISKPSSNNILSAETSYGSNDTYDTGFFASGSLKNIGISVTGEAFKTAGYFVIPDNLRGRADTEAASRHKVITLRLDRNSLRGNLDNRIFLKGTLFDEDRKNGTYLQLNDTATESLAAGGQFKGIDRGLWNIALYANQQRYHQGFSSISADRNSEALTRLQFVPSRDAGLSINRSGKLFDKHLLIAGFDVRGVRGTSDETVFTSGRPSSLVSAGGRQRRMGVFVQDIFQMTQRLTLSINARYDNWRDSSGMSTTRSISTGAITAQSFEPRSTDAFSPRLSLIYHPSNDLSFRASAYRAFRAPTLNELYRSFRVGNVLTTSNAGLTSEVLTGGEIGSDWKISHKATVRVTGFLTEVEDPITNFTVSTTPALITRQRRNLGRSGSKGIEAEGEFLLRNDLKITSGYIFADATIIKAPQDATLEGLQIPQVPRNQFTLQTVYSPRFITAAIQFRAAGKQFDDDQNKLALDSYALFDVSLSRRVNRYFDIFIASQNIFDQKVTVARTPIESIGMPRMIRGGVRINIE